MAGLVPAIHVFAALEQVVDARVKPGHDEFGLAAFRMTGECLGRAQRPYSAGLAAGGGGAAEGGVPAAELAAAAFFSTIRTAMIEPS
jgi:hypothetical protein